MHHPLVLPAVALAGLFAAALAGFAPAGATTDAKLTKSFGALESMSYLLGSKRAIGYFIHANGKCQVTLMIAEAVDPGAAPAPSAVKLTAAMVPGQKADLMSEEGESIALTCGTAARTVEVTRITAPRS
jgi:hypothetical protein